MSESLRDTDADWRRLGEVDPYFGVLSEPQFRRAVMGESEREAFYASGREDVAQFADAIGRWTGRAPEGGRSLDFGCGVGRLTEAMAERVDEACGYDISDGMVSEARTRSGRAIYTTLLPEGPFDWINSYIVFQHIPTERGMELLEALLVRLAPGGAVSLQFATEPADGSAPPVRRIPISAWMPRPLLNAWAWTAWFVAVMINPDTAPPRPGRNPHSPAGAPLGLISMYGYDMAELLRAFHRNGITDPALVATDHGGWRGYILVGRRNAPAPSSASA